LSNPCYPALYIL